MKKFQWEKKYLYWGLTALAVILSCIVFFMIMQRWAAIREALSGLIGILSPFIWGFVIAYILSPVMRYLQHNVFDKGLGWLFRSNPQKDAIVNRYSRAIAIFVSELLLLTIVAVLLWLILPQLYYSVDTIVKNSQTFMGTVVQWLETILKDFPEIEQAFTAQLGSVSNALFTWLQENVLPQMNNALSNFTSGVYYIIRGVYDVVIGVIVSVYVLFNKTTFRTSGRKLLFALFSPSTSRTILRSLAFTDRVIMDFITGKLLDSLIIAMICYVGCSILGMPYTLLVAVIIGITNIIPFFGPFIGAIPSTFIILTISPVKALIFVIFILVLQQFDGNILGPKILGKSTGVNGFWVMFSIILGTGLFGFAGMLLGVPVFVVVYTGIRYLINERLRKKGMPTDDNFYAPKHMEGELFPEKAGTMPDGESPMPE
ncbi:MAG: AI-2E family transporter, partial [Eubacteriales bacterium]|nr:AI-2E family transporter [Eubacteriales bacterium]